MARSRRLQTTDTADFGGEIPPPLIKSADLGTLLRHLDDARPTLTADPLDAESPDPARYLIGRELGSGSMGQVIEAVDRHLGRKVALKILHGGAGVTRDRIARFVAEAQITAHLEHPVMVPVYEIGIMPGGMPYFSMKLVQGMTLEELLNRLRIGDPDYARRYTLFNRVRMFIRLCQGVAYAHSKGVVHRDLKPTNVFLGPYGEVQIMDWGLSKLMPGTEVPEVVSNLLGGRELSREGAIAGTPAYMSPEQARGDLSLVGPPSDVFSLGLILAELLTLVRVHRQDSVRSVLEQARHENEVDMKKLSPIQLDPELSEIVRKATRADADNRYPDAGAMADDLAKHMENIARKQDLAVANPVKASGKNWLWIGIVLTLAVQGLILVLWRLFFS